MRSWKICVPFVLLLTALPGCGLDEDRSRPGVLRGELEEEQAGAPKDPCEPRTDQVIYLGSCAIPPGGTYTLPESDLRCRVVSAVNTVFQGSPACSETRVCTPRACPDLPSAPFSQAPMQGTAAPESFDPNMIGD